MPMTTSNRNTPKRNIITLDAPLIILDSSLISQLDQALAGVGAYGEVRLVISKGQLRFIQMVQSERIKDFSHK